MAKNPDRGAESKRISAQLFLRIHAETIDVDLSFVKKALEIVDDDEPQFAFSDDDVDITTLDFLNEPKLSGDDGQRQWQRAFRNAEKWFLKRTPDQFDVIRKAGLCADLCVVDYTGLFPSGLLSQALRLRMDFWVFSLGS